MLSLNPSRYPCFTVFLNLPHYLSRKRYQEFTTFLLPKLSCLRKLINKHYIGMNPDFRYRGEESSRIEAFSDAAFALAITLLVISQNVPNNFEALLSFIIDLVPFAICIALIMLLWYEHFIFFLRYGFRNPKIVSLNAVLLFLVLFYVYPLKFLAKVLTNIFVMPFIVGREQAQLLLSKMISPADIPLFMLIYGLGAAAIFLIFSLMYRYAYAMRKELNLSPIEIFDTKSRVFSNVIMASIPMLSAILALVGIIFHWPLVANLTGICYILYWPASPLYWKIRMKKRQLLTNL